MLTIIFIFSLFSFSAIISLKWIEEKKRRQLLFPRSRERADAIAAKVVGNIKIFSAVLNGGNGRLFAMSIRSALLSVALSIKRKLTVKKLKFLNSLKNSGNLRRQGPASFFLKNVSEYKPIPTPKVEHRGSFVSKDVAPNDTIRHQFH